MYIRSLTPSHNIKDFTLIKLEVRSGLNIRSSLISSLVTLTTRLSFTSELQPEQCSFNRLWAPRSCDLTHELLVPPASLLPKESSYKSIHPALPNYTDMCILHMHTPLDLTLLSHWRRVIDHIQNYNFSTLRERRIQLVHHRNQLQTAIRDVYTSLHSWRIRNCIWVSVAQRLLSNQWKLDRPHTEWRIFTWRIHYTSRPRNLRTSRSSTTTIAYSWDTGIAWYHQI